MRITSLRERPRLARYRSTSSTSCWGSLTVTTTAFRARSPSTRSDAIRPYFNVALRTRKRLENPFPDILGTKKIWFSRRPAPARYRTTKLRTPMILPCASLTAPLGVGEVFGATTSLLCIPCACSACNTKSETM